MRRLLTIGLALAGAWSAAASDITSGYTFTPGERNITHSKLNAVITDASINTSFFTSKDATTTPQSSDTFLLVSGSSWKRTTLAAMLLSNTNVVMGQAAVSLVDTNDWLLIYDTSAGGLGRATWNGIVGTNYNLINNRTTSTNPAATLFALLSDGTNTYYKASLSNIVAGLGPYVRWTNTTDSGAATNGTLFLTWDSTNGAPKKATIGQVTTYITNQLRANGMVATQAVAYQGPISPARVSSVVNPLGVVPTAIQVVLVQTNTAAIGGWLQNQEITQDGLVAAISVGCNATQLNYCVFDASPSIHTATNAAGTVTADSNYNWKIRLIYAP